MEYEAEDRVKKERSPSFPFIPLRKAIDRAQTMLNSHRRNPTRPSTVGETWGYSASSSGLVQTVAALKAYGLLEDVGKGEDRRVQLSDLALRIISDTRPGARESAIKEAVLRPKILSEYIGQWGLERPSDAHCVSELTLDRGFTQDAAKLFLRIFDDNLSFANLNNTDKIENISEIDTNASAGTQRALVPAGRSSQSIIEDSDSGATERVRAQQQRSPTVPAATLPLPEGLVTLAIPAGLSARSVKALKAWIDVIVDLAAWPANDTGPTDKLM